MKRGQWKVLLFEIIIILICIFNSFVSNILSGLKILFLLIPMFFAFKYIFGFSRQRNKYIKDMIMEYSIILMAGFIIFYLSGLFFGFSKVSNYYTWYGLKTFIIPTILSILICEKVKEGIVNKIFDNKMLYALTAITFCFVDITNLTNAATFNTHYKTFIWIALVFLPYFGRNIVTTYICKKTGYKPSLLWLLVISLYYYLLPIVPNVNQYIASVLKLLFPFIFMYRTWYLFRKVDGVEVVSRNQKSYSFLYVVASLIIVCIMVYFTSGYFYYYAVAIGSGSMYPTIDIGDVAVIEKSDKKEIKEGQVIAFKYGSVIIVHRCVGIVEKDGSLLFYTKGDNNSEQDNFYIKEEDVIGVVNKIIPMIGTPVIWMNRL